MLVGKNEFYSVHDTCWSVKHRHYIVITPPPPRTACDNVHAGYTPGRVKVYNGENAMLR